jgi:hypothetical protein
MGKKGKGIWGRRESEIGEEGKVRMGKKATGYWGRRESENG